MGTLTSYARRLSDLSAAQPDRLAVTCGPSTVTRIELDRRGTRLARDLAADGVGVGDFVTIAVPNSIDWFVTYVACWKLGAIPQPVSPRLPVRELRDIVALAGSKAVIGIDGAGALGPDLAHVVTRPLGYQPPAHIGDEPLPDAVSPAWKAPTSGGSTGKPKLIVAGDPSLIESDARSTVGLAPGGCLVMPGPLYHNGPGVWCCQGMLFGNHVVVLERFDAEATLAAVERYRADVLYLVPTMMKRISRLPDDVRLAFDLSSLRVVWHLAEPCPAWLKEEWIGWLGPDRIFELYAGTEAQAITVITGGEWLEHRGSVGRPMSGEFLVTDDDGNALPAGEQGEIWMRATSGSATYRYVGAEARTRDADADGPPWESLGDVGWFDADGYLYLADRKQDMILCGGANVYPAEVESVLQEHPAVQSVAVIGLPDEDKGNRIHAIVEPDRTWQASSATDDDELRAELLAFAAERLVVYKLPRTIEFVAAAMRDDAGKVRRSALRAERLAAEPPAN